FPINMAESGTGARRRGAMAIEKCIKEFGAGDVIFEEGSTGRELFVVLDGQVEIAKISGGTKTVIVTLGKGEFFGDRDRRHAQYARHADQPCPLRLPGKPAAGLCADGDGRARKAAACFQRS